MCRESVEAIAAADGCKGQGLRVPRNEEPGSQIVLGVEEPVGVCDVLILFVDSGYAQRGVLKRSVGGARNQIIAVGELGLKDVDGDWIDVGSIAGQSDAEGAIAVVTGVILGAECGSHCCPKFFFIHAAATENRRQITPG